MSNDRASALDGIRGVALACPIVVHLGIVGPERGLWLAIGMFFTLSAFLVTTLALREVDRSGSLKLGGFWMRRVRRLLPASVLVLLLTVIVAWWIDWPGLSSVRGDVMSALVWGANWEQLNGGGYWDAFSPSLTHHFWSLSFEEQVYIFFPLMVVGLVGLKKIRPGVKFSTLMAVAGALIVVASWSYLWTTNDASTLYLSTWSRLGEIGFGIMAASVSHAATRRRLSVKWSSTIISLTMVIVAPFWIFASGNTVDGIRSGITFATPLTAVVIAMLWRHPMSWPSRFFSLRIPAWLGRRSYGVYLLHLPIIDFLAFKLGDEHLSRPWMVVAVVATVIGAGVMFRWFEEPFRIGEFLPNARVMVGAMVGAMALVVMSVFVLVKDTTTVLAIPDAQAPPVIAPIIGEPINPDPGAVGEGPVADAQTDVITGRALVIGDSTAWVTSGAVDGALKPLGWDEQEVHMVGCAFGGDVRLKTSFMGGDVAVRELGTEKGCDEWWNNLLPQWLDSYQPTLVVVVGGYALAWEIDPNADDQWCQLADGSGRCEEWATGRLSALGELIGSHVPDAQVVWTTDGHVDPWGPLDIPSESIDSLNGLIREQASSTSADLIDLGAWMDEHLDLTVDGTHLGPEGVAALTPWIAEKLGTLLG